MIEAASHINWLGVLAAIVAHFFLGGLWFMGLFRKQYPASLGLSAEAPPPRAPRFLLGPMMCSAVTITTTAWLLRMLGVTSVASALGVGLLVGLGYLAAMTVNIAINPLFPHPFRYAAINAPMFVIGSLVSSVVLTAIA